MPDIVVKNHDDEDVTLRNVATLTAKDPDDDDVVFYYPEGDVTIVENGTVDVTGKKNVIVNVPSGGADSGVVFIDYDGSTVETWDAASVASKTALPPLPNENPRLVPGEWNWSLADIKRYVADYPDALVVVGHNPTTASGKTEFDITLTKVTGKTVTCNMVGNKNWGDGTIDSATSHTYTDYGDYTITCDGTSIPEFVFGQSGYPYNHFCVGVYIGNGVTSIAMNAFHSCRSLTNISVPNSVTSIAKGAIRECYSLASVTIPNGVASVIQNVLYGCYSLASVAIPNSVTSIGSSVFTNCYSLARVTIPDSVTSIDSDAFNTCRSLTSINVPNSVTSISTYAFRNCFSLASVSISDGVTSIGSSAFHSCRSLTSIRIPNGVTSIADSTFAGCSALTSVSIPDSVTSIGGTAFDGCSLLANIAIPDGVRFIYSYAFRQCGALPSVSIPDGVTAINTSTFEECSLFTSVTIPDSVTSIGSRAFYYCYMITKYDFTACTAVPTLANVNVFEGNNRICKIVVPDALYDDWIAATNWSTYADYIYKASEVTD